MRRPNKVYVAIATFFVEVIMGFMYIVNFRKRHAPPAD